jgi:hypothetical protein
MLALKVEGKQEDVYKEWRFSENYPTNLSFGSSLYTLKGVNTEGGNDARK